MKAFLVLALFIAASSARGTTSWNSLLRAKVFSEDLDMPRSRSGHPAVLVHELSALLNDPSVMDLVFKNYLSLFNKDAGSTLDFETGAAGSRIQAFKTNLIEIAAHNLEKHSWFQAVNQFTDLTAEEFRRIYTPSMVNLTAAFAASGLPRIPIKLSGVQQSSDVDWVSKGAVTGVKNQGQCGSCYAFATISALESAVAVAESSQADLDLSEQEVVDCSKNSGCGGGFWPASFDYMAKGVAAEAKYKYTSGTSQKAGSCNKSKARTKLAIATGYDFVAQADEDAMVSTLAEKGPLAVAVSTQNWQRYGGGVFDADCGTGNGVDHAVVLVGSSADAYVVKNSWGTSWGEQGYIKLKPGNNPCLIAEYPCWVTGQRKK